MEKLRVYLAQVNNTYGTNAFLPYSVGLLQAYALTIPEIKEHYEFCGFVYLREHIHDVIRRLDNPSVFGLSCYIWNWEFTIALAKAVKKAFPECLIVLGGPHVPVRSDGFFNEFPFADLLAHYEGEVTFSEILLERLKPEPDYTKVAGLSVNVNGTTFQTPMRPRLSDLSVIPSPYLTGVFNEALRLDWDFHATQETHRGCPYSCTFCDWGSNTFAKVKKFDMERLVAEIEWFADMEIDLLYNADANYGLFERDIELTRKMCEIKQKKGFPNKFRAAYAKNSNETVYSIAKMLNDNGMNKGITLSFQSMDDNVLTVIKRKNIKVKDFQGLMTRYRRESIATYSEIIIGLPGETYDTFAEGLDLLMRCGQHDSIQVYNCEVLPNAEMNEPKYRSEHEIKTSRTPVLFFHGNPIIDPHQEYYELVIGTKTLPFEDWLRTHLFSWVVQCCHCLSLTQFLAVFAYRHLGVPYRKFYESLLTFARKNPDSLIGQSATLIENLYRGLAEGKEWGIIDRRFSQIVWPPEEGTFLKMVVEKDRFYSEIADWWDLMAGSEYSDVLEYQKQIIIDPYEQPEKTISVKHNLHEWFERQYLNEEVDLVEKPTYYKVSCDNCFPDRGRLELYSRDVVWYGRKGGKFRHTKVTEHQA